jgi:hypothetical protein
LIDVEFGVDAVERAASAVGGPIALETALLDRRRAVVGKQHAATDDRLVVFERAVVKRRVAGIVIHRAAIRACVESKRAIAQRGAAQPVVHAAAAIVLIHRPVGITALDDQSVEHGIRAGLLGAHDDEAVVLVIGKIGTVVAVEITAEDGRIGNRVALIGIASAAAGIPALQHHPIGNLERYQEIPGPLVRRVSPSRDTNFVTGLGDRQRILQIGEGVAPRVAATRDRCVHVHVADVRSDR